MSYNGEQYSFIHLYMIYLTNTVRIMYHNIVITLIVKVASSIKMVVERTLCMNYIYYNPTTQNEKKSTWSNGQCICVYGLNLRI